MTYGYDRAPYNSGADILIFSGNDIFIGLGRADHLRLLLFFGGFTVRRLQDCLLLAAFSSDCHCLKVRLTMLIGKAGRKKGCSLFAEGWFW